MADVTDRVVYAYRSNGGAMRFFTSHRSKVIYKVFEKVGEGLFLGEGVILSGDLLRRDVGPEAGLVDREKVYSHMAGVLRIPDGDRLDDWAVVTLKNVRVIEGDPVGDIREKISV